MLFEKIKHIESVNLGVVSQTAGGSGVGTQKEFDGYIDTLGYTNLMLIVTNEFSVADSETLEIEIEVLHAPEHASTADEPGDFVEVDIDFDKQTFKYETAEEIEGEVVGDSNYIVIPLKLNSLKRFVTLGVTADFSAGETDNMSSYGFGILMTNKDTRNVPEATTIGKFIDMEIEE